MRQLVTLRTIKDIRPIHGADNIVCADIDGWTVVTRKGEFQPGDPCVYFEIDSMLPVSDQRFSFLSKNSPKTQNGVQYYRLRTIRLRGQISQGLALPISQFPETVQSDTPDLAAKLGVVLYDPPVPPQLAGQAQGLFPSFIRKTDQERAQNLVREIFEDNKDSRYEITTKLDGTSLTVFYRNGETGVCSRNLQLKDTDENKDNLYVRTAHKSGLIQALKTLGRNLACQGEVCGPGIQGNRQGLQEGLFLFDIQDLDRGVYLTPSERELCLKNLTEAGYMGSHVPVLAKDAPMEAKDIAELVAQAMAMPANQEGMVFKRTDGGFSFKIINNNYLLGEK